MFTPQTLAKKLAERLQLDADLYLKREDLHPLGSHKGRSLPVMINKYVEQGLENFVISSSGNVALAAALHIKELNRLKHFSTYTLTIFVGEKKEKNKLAEIRRLCHSEEVQRPKNPLKSSAKGSFAHTQDDSVRLIQVKNPKQQALLSEKSTNAKYLRQSTDDTALLGYQSLAEELSTIKNLSAVFIPTSSGTTAQALHEEFKKIGINPQIHIIQTTACHPIVGSLLNITPHSLFLTPSIATAIVDKIAHRKNKVAEAIKNSHGQGWIATNEEIKNAQNILQETENIPASPNSILSVVGLLQALQSNTKFTGPVVCLLTGK